MLHHTPTQYKDEDPYPREVDSPALANEPRNLEKADADFLENPKKCRFPKFLPKKHSRRSDPTNVIHHSIAIGYAGGKPYGVRLPRFSVGKVKIHRRPEAHWTLKSAAGFQGLDSKWYKSQLFEYETDGPDDLIDQRFIWTVTMF